VRLGGKPVGFFELRYIVGWTQRAHLLLKLRVELLGDGRCWNNLG